MKEKRILIVDDEPDVNLALRIVLEDNNSLLILLMIPSEH
jgi:DNA-binding NtrC family response regulator